MPKKRRGDTDGFAVIFSDHGGEIVPAFVRWRVNVHAAKIDGILADKKENCLLVGYFDNKILAKNALKYTKTKFFRAILKFQQLCQFNPYDQPSAFQPSIGLGFDDSKSWFDSDQGFDWSKSISEIDQQLFDLFNFPKSCIDFINRKFGDYDDVFCDQV